MRPNFQRTLTALAGALLAAAGLFAGTVEQDIAQMEKDWAEAPMKHDAATVERVVADDWIGLWFDGTTMSKADLVGAVKSGSMTAQSITLDPIKVRVFGDTAIATSADTEKSSYNGQDTSGRYVWTDVYARRNGKWQAVASQVTKVEMPHHH